MELAGAFRLGGDVDRAFDYGISRLTTAIGTARRRRVEDDEGTTPGRDDFLPPVADDRT
jgi:hypothetical protein